LFFKLNICTYDIAYNKKLTSFSQKIKLFKNKEIPYPNKGRG